jgi:branched-chain amino acid transport system ATP-binding protein
VTGAGSLRVRGAGKRFGGLTALAGVDLDVTHGEVVAVIGPNGAGKSTLLRLVAGLERPTALEELTLDGRDLRRAPAHRRRRAGLATVLQTPAGFTSMTVRQDVATGARFAGGTTGEAMATSTELLDRLGLAAIAERPTTGCTPHERRLVDLARALAGEPTVLLLDEVLAGLHPGEVTATVTVLRDLVDERHLGVVLVEHVLAGVRALADRVVVLHLGRVLATGAPDEVLDDPRVVAAYLGTREDRAC